MFVEDFPKIARFIASRVKCTEVFGQPDLLRFLTGSSTAPSDSKLQKSLTQRWRRWEELYFLKPITVRHFSFDIKIIIIIKKKLNILLARRRGTISAHAEGEGELCCSLCDWREELWGSYFALSPEWHASRLRSLDLRGRTFIIDSCFEKKHSFLFIRQFIDIPMKYRLESIK